MSGRGRGSGPSTVVTVRFKNDSLYWLDKVRGRMSRSAYVRAVVRKTVEDEVREKGLTR